MGSSTFISAPPLPPHLRKGLTSLMTDVFATDERQVCFMRSSTVNQDGRSASLTAPSGPAQEQLLHAALSDAQAQASEIAHFEVHGTGTVLGDPIEVAALGRVVAGALNAPMPLGGLKTNLAHLTPASGIAGLIKSMLVLLSRSCAPNQHFKQLNPYFFESLFSFM